jgi:pentapeptide MXKDX repeat protein
MRGRTRSDGGGEAVIDKTSGGPSMTKSRLMLPLAAAVMSFGLAFAPSASFADNMKKDSMTKDSMAKDNMKKDSMAKDNMKKDSMSKDNMKKDSMKKDNMSH